MSDKISKLPVQPIFKIEELMIKEIGEVIAHQKYDGMSTFDLIGTLESIKFTYMETLLRDDDDDE